MILGISYLAFDSIEDFKNKINLLKVNNIKNIEIVFSKFNSEDELNYFLELSKNNGFIIKSTQSLLFNSDIIDLTEYKFVSTLHKLIKKCKNIGIETLILGSPKQRIDFDELKLINNFRKIDELLIEYEMILCIEPNCKLYNGNYFFTVSEIVDFLKKGNFINIKTMIDTHNIINEKENLSSIMDEYKKYIHHIHISENGLNPINSDYHNEFSLFLKKINYNGIVTYEVISTSNIELFSSLYCNKIK